MHQDTRRSVTPAWQWLCLIYTCLGVAIMLGHVHLGVWLPGVIPEIVWGLVWLVCAAGTWQGKYTSVRGSLSILAPALSATSYSIDFVIRVVSTPPMPPVESVMTLTHCVLWGSVCALVNTITRLDQPGS